LGALEKAGGKAGDDARKFANGNDNAALMIKGVVTVLVDLGYQYQDGQAVLAQTLGSAFFVDPSGLLITNYHVIASEVDPSYNGYSKLYVRFGGSANPRIQAKIVGYDKALDLALLKVDVTPDYVFSVIGAVPASPEVGDNITAIGSPAGLEQTVTRGIVSALGRRLLALGDVIQIDAAINPGNSGGPVLDAEGRIVGVAFAQAGDERGVAYAGLNFAIPVSWLVADLPLLLQGESSKTPRRVDHSWLGMALNVEGMLGAVSSQAQVVYNVPDTPAQQQEVVEGSHIKAIDGRTFKDIDADSLIPALQAALFSCRSGELVKLEIIKADGTTVSYLLQTTSRPDVPLKKACSIDTKERLIAPLFGIVLTSAGDDSRAYYSVKQVLRGSVADGAGIQSGDIVSIMSFRTGQQGKPPEVTPYVVVSLRIKQRSQGFLESYMSLPAALDSSDLL
jgi:S1-C subfamily serine protease